MKKLLLSALVLSGFLVGCKDDDDNCDLNSANLAGTYQVTGLTYKANTAATPVDIYATYDACEKDDRIVFNTNGTVTYSDAGVVCVPDGNDTGVWALSGSMLTLDGEAGAVTSFNCTGMTLSVAGTTAGEVTTVTLVRR
jgi:hypothetical protein